jgi:hypothetical protein
MIILLISFIHNFEYLPQEPIVKKNITVEDFINEIVNEQDFYNDILFIVYDPNSNYEQLDGSYALLRKMEPRQWEYSGWNFMWLHKYKDLEVNHVEIFARPRYSSATYNIYV